MRYTVVIEKGERNFSAYVPDLPGCVSVGDTVEEVKTEICEVIELHLEGMREDDLPIPSFRVGPSMSRSMGEPRKGPPLRAGSDEYLCR